MNQNTPLRIGVIGTNFVSDWLCEAAGTLDCVDITAVYSRAEQTGTAFAEKHGIHHVFTTAQRRGQFTFQSLLWLIKVPTRGKKSIPSLTGFIKKKKKPVS